MQERFKSKTSQGSTDATIQVARKMLDVVDNCNRAFSNVSPETDEQKAIEAAFKKAYGSILSTFEELGIKEIATVGTEFDYEVHQAVMQRPSEFEEGFVCEELQKGYMFQDKLVRAAMVVVSF
jgi:molecular chaperone GrpE